MILFSFTDEHFSIGTQDMSEVYEYLIANMAQGNTEAFETLYSHTKAAVYGFALSILKNRHDAEDVMQDTYVRLYQSAKIYRAQGKPMAWVLTITRNLAFMKLRSAKELPLPEEPSLSVEDDFSKNSVDKMVLEAALNLLGEDERQIVMLHSVSGLKHREIAELLQLPLSTVLSKYRRALSKLKKQMEEDQ